MIVRQTSTTIVSLQLILLLLLSCHVTSISLSQFQQIQGFSISCENVWQVDIPGCSKRDFTNPNDCSRNCIAGVNIINAEVLVACSDARVSSNTLLAQFLAGYGVSALCGESGGSTETTATIADSTTATATAIKTATTSTGLSSVQSTAATTTTTTAVGVKSTQQSRTSITVDVTTSTSTSTLATTSSTSTPTIEPNLTLSFTETTSTASLTSSSSSTTSATSSKSSSTSNPEAKGFGGVGDANDILGGEGSGDRLACIPWEVMSLISILVVSIASAIW